MKEGQNMATAKTTYIDENGVKQTGYINGSGIYTDYLTKTANSSSGIYADYLKKAANDQSGIYSAILQKNAEDMQGQIDRLNGQYEQLICEHIVVFYRTKHIISALKPQRWATSRR